MADQPVLPELEIPGFYSPHTNPADLQYLIDVYTQYTSGMPYAPSYGMPGGYPGAPSPPPAETMDPLPPVVDDDTGWPVEIDVDAPRVPLQELTDQELIEYGGDAAYDELDRRRGGSGDSYGNFFNDGTEAFAPPMPMPQPIAPTVIGIVADVLTRVAPWFAPFIPLTAGPQELDEAPTPPRRPPPTPPPPLDPIMPPNWEDLAYEPRDFGEIIDELPGLVITGGRPRDIGDLFRPVLPIGDYPGLFEAPYGLPELPIPYYPFPEPTDEPSTRPRTPTQPVRTTPQPFVDPFELDEPYPYAYPQPEPRFLPRPDPIGDPISDPFNPTIPDYVNPPRIGDPYIPPVLPPVPFIPGIDTPPGYYVPPSMDPQFVEFPFGSPQPPPFDTSNCPPCKKEKKKKKKKKPRRVCYRGSYREYAKGLSKTRLEEIPCEPTKPKGTTAKRAAPKRNPRFPDLAKDIFGLP